MKLVWRTAGDDKVCSLCQSLEGRVDGDGWSSANGREIDLWQRDEDGEWKRRSPADVKLYGSPPLHPNCRCSVVEED